MEYYKEKDGDLLIRMTDEGEMQRYDLKTDRWVEDQTMAQIFYGGILAKLITEEEAMAIITKKKVQSEVSRMALTQ